MIVWREKMSVGHAVIDADHRYLLCLVSSVELAMRTNEPLDELLDQLIDYAQFHFKREEHIQLDVRYPNAERHRHEHRQLAAQLSETVAKLRSPAQPAAANAVPAAPEPEAQASDSPAAPDAPASSSEGAAPETGAAPPQATPEEAAAAVDAASVVPEVPRDTAATADLVDLLRRWLIDHILREDMQFKPYVGKHATARGA